MDRFFRVCPNSQELQQIDILQCSDGVWICDARGLSLTARSALIGYYFTRLADAVAHVQALGYCHFYVHPHPQYQESLCTGYVDMVA